MGERRTIIDYYLIQVDYRDVVRGTLESAKGRRREWIDSLNYALNMGKIVRHGNGNFFIFPTQEMLQSGLNPETVWKVIDECGLFTYTGNKPHTKRGIAKRYLPTPLLSRLMADYCNNYVKEPVVLVNIKKEGVKLFPHSNVPRRVLNNLPADYKTTCTLDVDRFVEHLRRNRGVYSEENYNKLKRLETYLVSCKTNTFMLRYVKCSTGRLFQTGGIEVMQNIPKEARSALNHGKYDIDIVNCQWSILAQIANVGPWIKRYAERPDAIRNSIADAIDAEPSEVKHCLLMLLFGTGRRKYISIDDAIPQLLGRERAYKFMNHHLVQIILDELDTAIDSLIESGDWDHMIECYPNKTQYQLLAHCLQGYEALIMEAVVDKYENEGLYFDGFITAEDIDTDELSEHVKLTTALDVEFSKKLIEERDPERFPDPTADLEPVEKLGLV